MHLQLGRRGDFCLTLMTKEPACGMHFYATKEQSSKDDPKFKAQSHKCPANEDLNRFAIKALGLTFLKRRNNKLYQIISQT